MKKEEMLIEEIQNKLGALYRRYLEINEHNNDRCLSRVSIDCLNTLIRELGFLKNEADYVEKKLLDLISIKESKDNDKL